MENDSLLPFLGFKWDPLSLLLGEDDLSDKQADVSRVHLALFH